MTKWRHDQDLWVIEEPQIDEENLPAINPASQVELDAKQQANHAKEIQRVRRGEV